MALTNSVIGYVQNVIDMIDLRMTNYAEVAKDTIEKLKKNEQFGKYLMDTDSGARLYTQLLDLLAAVDETENVSKDFTHGVIGNFLWRQRQINDNGR